MFIMRMAVSLDMHVFWYEYYTTALLYLSIVNLVSEFMLYCIFDKTHIPRIPRPFEKKRRRKTDFVAVVVVLTYLLYFIEI